MVHITHYKDRIIVDYDNNATTRARSVVAVSGRQPFVMEDIYFKTYMYYVVHLEFPLIVE